MKVEWNEEDIWSGRKLRMKASPGGDEWMIVRVKTGPDYDDYQMRVVNLTTGEVPRLKGFTKLHDALTEAGAIPTTF